MKSLKLAESIAVKAVFYLWRTTILSLQETNSKTIQSIFGGRRFNRQLRAFHRNNKR